MIPDGVGVKPPTPFNEVLAISFIEAGNHLIDAITIHISKYSKVLNRDVTCFISLSITTEFNSGMSADFLLPPHTLFKIYEGS